MLPEWLSVTTYPDAQCLLQLEFIFNLYKRSKCDQFLYLKGTYIHAKLYSFYTLIVTFAGHQMIDTFLIYTNIAPSPLHFLPPPLTRSAGLHLTWRERRHLRCLVLAVAVPKICTVVIVSSNDLDGNSFP